MSLSPSLRAQLAAGAAQTPLPLSAGEEGPKRSLGGEGLYTRLRKTLTSHRFAVGPSSPAESGRGRIAAVASLLAMTRLAK
jgi:hypothetical protein